MSLMFKDREIFDQLSVARPSPLRSGVVGPDFGLIPGIEPLRIPPGAIRAQALVDRSPSFPAFIGACLPEQSSCGFGADSDQLYGSATGEFVERYSAGYVPDRVTSLDCPIIPASRFVPFTDAQYAADGFPYVHPSSVPDIPYVKVHRAIDHSAAGVPADLVYLNPADRQRWCTVTSNGLGAGRTYGAAARSAVFELIERDAFMRAWYGKRGGVTLRLPTHIPESFSPRLKDICRQLRLLDVEVTLVRFEGVGGVPVILSCARSDKVGLAVGCSSKPDVRNAMAAAFTESVQTYNWGLSAKGDAPDDSSVTSLEGHIAFHARIENRGLNEFIDDGPAVSELEFIRDGVSPLFHTLRAVEDSGWQVYLGDVRSTDVVAQGWHVVRALSPQAATLDVDEPHMRQHPGAVNLAPHPFP